MKNTTQPARQIPRPDYITRAIDEIIDRMNAQTGTIDEKTGKPILNGRTTAKLAVIVPAWQKIHAGKKITTAEQICILQQLHTSTNMTAKLEDVNAISTACSVNPICKRRAADPCSICSHCFAFATFERYDDLEQAAIINFIILNMMVYSPAAWRAVFIPASAAGDMFRIEAFGDTASAIQAANYVTLARTHAYLGKVGVWSKNLGYWAAAFETLGKPRNVVFNASSPVMNQPMQIPERFTWFIDHLFTVYTADHALAENVEINCGDRKCETCRRCYKTGNAQAVNEIVKNEAKRYYKALGKDFTGRK